MPSKKKLKHDISGVHNQTKSTTASSHTQDLTPCDSDTGSSMMLSDPSINNNPDDKEWTPNVQFDSNKLVWNSEESENDIDSENEEDFLDKIEEEKPGVNPRKYRNKALCVALMRMAINIGDDPMDEDWVPKHMRKKLQKEKKFANYPKEYKKGPDVGSKSRQTKHCYKSLLKDQKTLSIRNMSSADDTGSESDSSGFGE